MYMHYVYAYILIAYTKHKDAAMIEIGSPHAGNIKLSWFG
jgi:hypothetical protein